MLELARISKAMPKPISAYQKLSDMMNKHQSNSLTKYEASMIDTLLCHWIVSVYFDRNDAPKFAHIETFSKSECLYKSLHIEFPRSVLQLITIVADSLFDRGEYQGAAEVVRGVVNRLSSSSLLEDLNSILVHDFNALDLYKEGRDSLPKIV
jgi:hypothetical protein